MKKLVALLVFCFCFGSMAMANGLEGNGTLTEHTIKHKGIEYSYYLYTPKNLPKGAPLVIFFHGYGANNVPATGFGFNPIADKNGFAICYPRGPKGFRDMEVFQPISQIEHLTARSIQRISYPGIKIPA